MRLFNAMTSALLFTGIANGQVLPLDINGERYAINCNENVCNTFSPAQILDHGLVAESLIYTNGRKFVLYKTGEGDYCINVGALSHYQNYVVKAGRIAFKMSNLLGSNHCPTNGIKLAVDDVKTALSGKNISIFIAGDFNPVKWEQELLEKESSRLQVRGKTLYLDPKPLEGYLEFTQVRKTEVK
tara:strand:- start:8483 stop:9037 length:555 start_codon:yes stop_codon:yes gene_type:complete